MSCKLAIEDLSLYYGDFHALKSIHMEIQPNEITAFIGPSGCGKSTLLKIMQGMLEPDSGSVVIGPTVKIGYFAQEIQLGKDMDPNQRVIDYIRDVAEYVETDEGKITAARLLERFLFRGEDQYGLIGKLSGGERRRLYLCKVLMSAPNVLILDEPTNALDTSGVELVKEIVRGEKKRGALVIISCHDLAVLEELSDEIIKLESGKVIEHIGRA